MAKAQSDKNPGATYTVPQEAFEGYKKLLRRRITWVIFFLGLISIEWLCGDALSYWENSIIDSIQTYFGITELKDDILIHRFSILTYYQFVFLVLTHVFIVFYFYRSPLAACKLQSMTILSSCIICIMQMLYEDPRPYWETDLIVGAGCPNSYSYPSYDFFLYLFVFTYGRYSWDVKKDNASVW
eukprot:CAMPEP_0114593684 /NCGR_PEP_ID=MMETSP0125-20121206/15271_1 /TAXON_ID=485358 ORGANISM="Aristerostoma sp., Strain ATCC 50986" /NCGR_SAMPLE_ID=MMETSP0125 /ASSEMBLY_ACC=CAM_ASM_000245 /LENGTH=183 /DNA_ID=CAMNT_0001793095 /DNA_START=172 /DNA_END=720 /DNA_ORIENTATION=+